MNQDASTLLHALGGDGYLGICWKLPTETDLKSAVLTVPEALTAIDAIGDKANQWYGVNRMARKPATGRGRAADITRVTCLYADLDTGKALTPGTVTEARTIIDGLPDPMFIVYSGHGLQPIWPLTGDEFTVTGAEHHAELATLVKRWGQLIADRCAARGWVTDPVYDLARILRVPGTINHKYPGKPVRARMEATEGVPLTHDEVTEILAEHERTAPKPRKIYTGKAARPAASTRAVREWLDKKAGFQRAATPYGSKALDGLIAEYGTTTEGRHPWMVRSVLRVVELANKGHLDGHQALSIIRDKFTELIDDGERPPQPDEFTDAVRHAVGQLTPGGADQSEPDDDRGGEHWDTPVPLGTVPVLPAFPVDAFPPWLRQEVICLTEFAQVPADLPAVITLAVLAAAAGGRAVVEIRGSWREPLNLYTATAMPPGSRKSAVFAELTQPLLDTEQSLVERVGPQIIEAATQRKIAQRDADKLAAKASSAEGDNRAPAEAEAIAAAQMAEAITVPVMPKLVADDITPEAAASLLAEQGGRLAVLSAEGGCFSTLSGRYSSAPNLEVFLKGHSGDMLRVDRKGRPPEHIPHPALTLGLAVQPQVLRDIAGMPGFRGRGLLARILYAIPPNTVGARKIRTDPIPEDIRDTYAASIQSLVLTLAEWNDPAVLMLTPEAAELLLTTAEELEPRLGPDGDLGHIADWASKLIGATARIAGLLHLAAHLQDGWGKPISCDTMTAAVRVAGYFTAHALAAFDGMGADPVLEDTRHVLGWIARQEQRFTKRELFRAEQSRFRKIADLDPVLVILEQHGYIRLADQPERQGPGRKPSPEYLIHPDLDEASVRC